MTDRITSLTKRYARERRRQKKKAVRRWKREQRRGRGEALGLSSQDRREIACFWTWPFGHVYEKTPAKLVKICMVCQKKVDTSEWGGG